MKFDDMRRAVVFSGAVQCSVGAALAIGAVYTLAKSDKDADGQEKNSWAKYLLGGIEGGAAAALLYKGVQNLRRY